MDKLKRPRDPSQLGRLISEIATGQKKEPRSKKNQANVEMGRLGGLKGGLARAKKLTPAERKAIAKKAAEKRWNTQNRKKSKV